MSPLTGQRRSGGRSGAGRPATLAKVGAGVTACAIVGSLLGRPDSRWYRSLDKPAFTPPDWVVPVVWTSLYGVLAVSSAKVIDDLTEEGRGREATAYTRALALNLTLNAGWSGLFFRAQNLALATVGAAALTLSSADLARRGRAAGGWAVGLAAYTAWTGFATVLSGSLAKRNR